MDANKIIDDLGGTNEVARLCDIQPPSVSEWREKNAIPKARLMFLRLLRPDVFAKAENKERRRQLPKKVLVVKNCQETIDPNFEDRRGNKS